MRRTFASVSAATLLALIAALTVHTPASLGQTPAPGPFAYIGANDQMKTGAPPTPALASVLAGTWTIISTAMPPPAPGAPAQFPGLVSYTAEGGFLETDPLGPSTGQGNWVATGSNTFAYTFVRFLFDASGKFIGSVKGRAAGTLNAGLDGYTTVGKADVLDPTGKVVASLMVNSQATRLRVEPVQ